MQTTARKGNTLLGSVIKKTNIRKTWPLWLMMLIPLGALILFQYVPMAGLRLAFVKYNPTKGIWGSQWVGLKYFDKLFSTVKFWTIIRNTVVIAVEKMAANLFFSLLFAILLTEIRSKTASKFFQSVMLFPWFVSWIILSTIFKSVFSLDGPVNMLLTTLGFEPVPFFSSNGVFRALLVLTDTWKGMGYNMVIFITAIYAIDPGLFEAATVDGANKFQQKVHITLPCIAPMIVLRLILSIGGILSAGSDQILTLYNSSVYDTAEIIDTYVYKIGIESAQYSLATAVGIFKSVIGGILIIFSYMLAERVTNYRIF